MKKYYSLQKLLALLALFFISMESKAQFVTIPDPVFVSYLQTVFPSAMSGNQMDTTSLSITQYGGDIDVHGIGIADLTGIEYFDRLTSLRCQMNQLSFLPPLPNTINLLYCGSNNLISLGNLPDSLVEIICDTNQLTSLPVLPSRLGYLLCAGNQLTSLPPLPSQLWFLNAMGNQITCLPVLPNSLNYLLLVGNPVNCLPNIPNNGNFSSDIGTTLCNGFFTSGLNQTPISCFGFCDGELVAATISSTAFDYIWSNGFSDLNNAGGVSSITALCAGYYSVTITPTGGGCVRQLSSTLSQPIQSQLGQPSINGMSCLDDSTWVYYPGNPPYTFQWSNGAVGDSVYLPAGNYSVSVTGVPTCALLPASFTVAATTITVSLIATNVTCNLQHNGSITVNVTGGSGPYNFGLNGSFWQPINVYNNLAPGTYTVSVTDANGCVGSAIVTITEPPPLTFGNILSNYLVCNANPVNICYSGSGGTPGYTYLWSDGSVMNCISALPGLYTITVVDANGCSISSITSVTYTPGWQFVSLDNITLPTCGMCDGVATAVMINTVAATYQWIPGNFTGITNPQLCDNTDYMLIAVDTGGCVDTLNFSLSCHSVWPGDANNDGQADNTDLLAIGIGYGVMGDIRPNATINWQGEIGFDWADSLASGTNYKHVDCNGDGVIADDDTIAIIQNFGLTHALHPATITALPADPPLYFDIQIDSTNIDTILQIPIMLGTAAIPADSIYGIAFTVSYDTALVKADSLTIDFINCWMNSATGHTIGIGINDPLNGKLYAAVTRTSHTDTSGFGELGRLGVVTVDNISARMSSLRSDTLIFSLSDVVLITHDEQYKTVNIINDTLILNDNTVAISEHTEPFRLNVYPNPTNRFLFMDYDAQKVKPVITLRSIIQEEVDINFQANNEKAIIDLGPIANGIYLLSVTTEKGVVTRKINVMKP